MKAEKAENPSRASWPLLHRECSATITPNTARTAIRPDSCQEVRATDRTPLLPLLRASVVLNTPCQTLSPVPITRRIVADTPGSHTPVISARFQPKRGAQDVTASTTLAGMKIAYEYAVMPPRASTRLVAAISSARRR